MKIIFSMCLLGIAGLSVSSAQLVELNYIEGQTVTFKNAVEDQGRLIYGGDKGKPIGDVTGGQFIKLGDRDGVVWDSSTGFFSLTGLKMEDAGLYTVLNNDDMSEKTYQYQLKVYKDNVNVSTPLVNITQDTHPCTILCTVERGTAVTLSWYREGETKIYVSSLIRNAPHLDLPIPVENGGTYTCEAKNSVSRETTSLPVGKHCSGVAAVAWRTEGCKLWITFLALIVMLHRFLA